MHGIVQALVAAIFQRALPKALFKRLFDKFYRLCKIFIMQQQAYIIITSKKGATAKIKVRLLLQQSLFQNEPSFERGSTFSVFAGDRVLEGV
jgi:hypothetical protein